VLNAFNTGQQRITIAQAEFNWLLDTSFRVPK
jgi:hypothetical protein